MAFKKQFSGRWSRIHGNHFRMWWFLFRLSVHIHYDPQILTLNFLVTDNCRFGFLKAEYMCFDSSCMKLNENKPIRLCKDCDTRYFVRIFVGSEKGGEKYISVLLQIQSTLIIYFSFERFCCHTLVFRSTIV